MKKVLSVFLVLGLLLSVGFATENSFDNQINNSISTVKQAFITKKINQADLLAKLTVMSLIEKEVVAKIKTNDISDEIYLQALDKCNEISNDVTAKIVADLENNNHKSLNTFNAFINGYKQKAGNILTCQQNCIENIKEFTGNKFGINSNIYTNNPNRKIIVKPDGTVVNTDHHNHHEYTVGDAMEEGYQNGTHVGTELGGSAGAIIGGYAGATVGIGTGFGAGSPVTGPVGAVAGAAVGGGIGASAGHYGGGVAGAIGAAIGHFIGSYESGDPAQINHNYHPHQNQSTSTVTETEKPIIIPVVQKPNANS